MKWFNTLSHNRWLEQETDRIFDFGKNSVVPTGFGWLGNKGQIKEEMGTHLWITARMLHVYSVAAAMGRPGREDEGRGGGHSAVGFCGIAAVGSEQLQVHREPAHQREPGGRQAGQQ